MPYPAWSELPLAERRAAALDALRTALLGCGFHLAAQATGRSIVVNARRGVERIEIHFRSSMGTGPAYWPKSTFQLATDRYGGLAILDDEQPPKLFLVPSLAWNRPDGVLVDRTYPHAASAPEWGINLPGGRAALDRYALHKVLGCSTEVPPATGNEPAAMRLDRRQVSRVKVRAVNVHADSPFDRSARPMANAVERVLDHVKVLGESTDWEAATTYESVALALIDAVWSIGVRYTGVLNVLERYRVARRRHGEDPGRDSPADLVAFIEDRGGAEGLAVTVGNRQRTSSHSGILKAEAVLLAARALVDAGREPPRPRRAHAGTP